MLLNLIVNGMDAMAETRRRGPALRMRTCGRDGEIVVEVVEDAGHGIAAGTCCRGSSSPS